MSFPDKMKAPVGVTSANIEGHTYTVSDKGTIKVLSETHVETLRRHGFEAYDGADEITESDIDDMDDKAELVEFIEERGGEADQDMSFKKLRRLAKEALVEAQKGK